MNPWLSGCPNAIGVFRRLGRAINTENLPAYTEDAAFSMRDPDNRV